MSRHLRLYDDGEALGAVPTVEGRVDDLALGLLTAHPDFDRDAFTWVGSEHLGGGMFCASLYTGIAAESPYLWVTQGDEDAEKFLACVYVGGADGEEPEDPFLVAECGVGDLAAEAMRMLDSAGRQPNRATTLPAPNAGQGRAIEQSVANFRASAEFELIECRVINPAEFLAAGEQPDGLYVEFLYRDYASRPDRPPGREVTVYGESGAVLSSQDFG